MGTVILIRHGRSTANVSGTLSGRLPGVTLDEVGKEQAKSLAAHLGDLQLAHIACSPMERTIETARLVFGANADIAIHEDIIECDYGVWSGRKLTDLRDEPVWEIIQSNPASVEFPGGESMQSMSDRAVQFVRKHDAELTQSHGESVTWALISHADIIKAIIADAYGLPLNNFQRIAIEPASVSVIRYSQSGDRVLRQNQTGDFTVLDQRDPGWREHNA